MDHVSVLNPAAYQNEDASGGNAAQAKIPLGPYQTDALVLVSASGSAKYKGADGKNAGIILTIKVGTSAATIDDSFEGSSWGLAFRCSASHNFVLKQGQSATVEARVDQYGNDKVSNVDTKVSLSCFALAARSEGAKSFA